MKGKLTLSKNNKGTVNLELTEEISGIRVIDAQVPLVEFANALFGLAYQECTFEITSQYEFLGQVRINKHLIVEVKNWGNKEEAKTAFREAIKKYPGWNSSFNLSGAKSFYNSDGKTYAKTNMYKYIPIDSEEVDLPT